MNEARREPSPKQLDALLPPETAALVQEHYRRVKQSEADLASYRRIGRRLEPLLALACVSLALALFAVVGLSLVTGETNSFQKYSPRTVLRAVEPSAYWFSVGAHSALAAFFGWLGVATLRKASIARRGT